MVILGDSFTGVYQRTYCENAGISAHLAHQLQHPVDLVMSYGGGPNVRKKLLTRGEADLRRKRLLIWIFAGARPLQLLGGLGAAEGEADDPKEEVRLCGSPGPR